jgi:hypothetical protein
MILREDVKAYMPTPKRDQRLTSWLLKHGANPNLPDAFRTSPMF